jgi:hypothetical protein
MITKYERTVLDLAAALAAQLIEAKKHDRQEAKHSFNEGTDLRYLRDNASRGSGIRSTRAQVSR